MKESTFTCSLCGAEHPISDIHELGRLSICRNCLENCTLICSECGERILDDENAGSSSIPLCEDCYDRYYTTCERCGALIRQSDAYYLDGDGDPYCEYCYEIKAADQAIHDYYYKPTPIFYGEGKRFFGVELEIDEGGEYYDNAQQILYVANENGSEHIYCKHDGSLDEGFEIVTHPMTLAEMTLFAKSELNNQRDEHFKFARLVFSFMTIFYTWLLRSEKSVGNSSSSGISVFCRNISI